MRILIIGDVFGRIGREVLKKNLLRIKKEEEIDLVLANVENATNGKGLSLKHYQEIKSFGVDLMTSGNHIFDKQETEDFIKLEKYLIRPLNFNKKQPGKGSVLLKFREINIRITNLIGNSFMNQIYDNPYTRWEEEILGLRDWDIHLVDFHAETTAEKIAFALHYDGEITALFGTHTHVQTSDERILKKGTAFITDVGMTGPSEGIIGAEINSVIERLKYGYSRRINPLNKGQGQFNAIIISLDKNNKVKEIRRLNLFF